MRNYIILNGVNSNTLTGLLISKLPPITKPKQRTQTEEIDGRDGDIVTTLGYGAYDKTIDIGLYGDFDIEDIMTYFNSSGTVTFSNEEDKYYNYQIVDQIDFDRLIRFRTAKVKMHVQPFKYSSVEGTRTYNITSEEEITINNSGNYVSKPVISITGSGTINLSVNGYEVLVIELGEDATTITIDTANMEAYNQNTSELMNRSVTGDYDNLYLNAGSNTISWTGTITQIQITNYSRWL
jgi:predicted phage tail component-like protein